MAVYGFECERCQRTFYFHKPLSEPQSIAVCPFCWSIRTRRKGPPPDIRQAPVNARASNKGSTGILVRNSTNVQLTNVTVDGFGTGISVENSDVHGKGNLLRRNQRGLHAKDSVVNMPDLVIE